MNQKDNTIFEEIKNHIYASLYKKGSEESFQKQLNKKILNNVHDKLGTEIDFDNFLIINKTAFGLSTQSAEEQDYLLTKIIKEVCDSLDLNYIKHSQHLTSVNKNDFIHLVIEPQISSPSFSPNKELQEEFEIGVLDDIKRNILMIEKSAGGFIAIENFAQNSKFILQELNQVIHNNKSNNISFGYIQINDLEVLPPLPNKSNTLDEITNRIKKVQKSFSNDNEPISNNKLKN